MTARNPEIFVKICPLVSNKIFETKTIFPGLLYRGPDAKILCLSTQRPQLYKNLEPMDLLFWRYGVKGSTFPPPPQKLGGGGRSPPYFAQGILGMTPKP